MADIKYVITVDAQGAVKSVQDFEKALDGESGAAGRSKKAHESLTGQIVAGLAIYEGFKKTLGTVAGFIGDTTKAAMDQEQADRNLAAALDLTGRTVDGNIQHYLQFAAAKQKVTKYTDDEIEKSQALLLQMTTLNQDGIDRAMKGSMGLASVMGMDLYSATMAVTKGMEGNYQALGRVGIRVDENLTAEEKQASLLNQLEGLYGRATSEMDTSAGSLGQLKKAWGETEESIGKFIITQTGANSAFQDMKDIVSVLPILLERLGNAGNGLMRALGPTGMALAVIRVLLHDVAGEARQVMADYESQAEATAAVAGKTATFSQILEGVKKYGLDWKAIVSELPGKINQFGNSNDKANKGLKEQTKLMETGIGTAKKFERVLAEIGTTVETTTLPAQNKLTMGMINYGFSIPPVYAEIAKLQQKTAEMAQRSLDNFQAVSGGFAGLFSALGALSDANLAKQMQNLDLEYAARKSAIDQMLLSEEERVAMLGALDAEFAAKRAAARKTAGQQSKAWSIWEATINTAQAITAALASKPFLPMGPIMAALAAAQGAIQIAAIKAQPIPLASGALFDSPVFSPRGNYVAGEASYQEEGVIPLKKGTIRRVQNALDGGGSGRPIILHNTIELNGVALGEQVIEIVQDALDRRKLTLRHARFN